MASAPYDKIPRYFCIGGWDGGNVVPGIRLMELYRLLRGMCLVAEYEEDPRLLGIDLTNFTVLRPQFTYNAAYQVPGLHVPLTSTVRAMLADLVISDFQDTSSYPILADALEDAEYNDPNYPWLLKALRDPREYYQPWKHTWDPVLTVMRIQELGGYDV